jgi:hypothetical protein
MVAPHHTDAADPVPIDAPHFPGHSEDSSCDMNSSFAPTVGDPYGRQLDHEGVTSSWGVIIQDIIENDALSHTELSHTHALLDTSQFVTSDNGTHDALFVSRIAKWISVLLTTSDRCYSKSGISQ